MLIDTHCHIDRFSDPARLARKCESDGIMTVAVTNLPSHYELALPHLDSMRYIKLAVGFHPLVVSQHKHELNRFLELVSQVQFVGEIGLDFSREGIATKSEQTVAFNRIIEVLADSKKFVTMHSRGAADEVLDVMKNHHFHHAVFHWFSGTLASLDRAIQWGCWFSVNPSMTRSQKGKSIISKLPKDRVLTETDGPYVKIGNRLAEPADVRGVVSFLADAWEVSEEDVELQVSENFYRAANQLVK